MDKNFNKGWEGRVLKGQDLDYVLFEWFPTIQRRKKLAFNAKNVPF